MKTTDMYSQVIQKTTGMVRDKAVQRLAQKHGLHVLDVTWEDTARFDFSAVGPNISDMTIQVQHQIPGREDYELACMPVIRYPNFSDVSGDISPDEFFVLVGNQKGQPLAFAKDLVDPEQMRAWLLELSEQVGCRMRRHGLKGRTVQLKVRYEDFHTITRAQTLPQPTNVTQEIWQTADQMFAERLPARRLHIRLLGVGMSGFEHPATVQLSLFPEAERERQARLDEVADQIKARFGQAGLQRALGLLHNVEHRERRPGEDRDQYGK